MNISQRLLEINEPYAAGFFEDEGRGSFYRFAKAIYRFLQHCPLPAYSQKMLYPCGAFSADFHKQYALYPQFSRTYDVDYSAFDKKDRELSKYCLENMPQRERFGLDKALFYGTAYTHSTPYFERVLAEGLNSYRQRIQKAKDRDFREGCLLVLDAFELFKNRCVTYLREQNAPEKLILALERVPFAPATDLYEAVVAWNFIYYMDLCDNVGQLDKGLLPYYKGEPVEELLREFFQNVNDSAGWDVVIGPQVTPFTLPILRAARGLCRPQVHLMIDGSTPDQVWREAIESIAAGNANPSLYNYDLYYQCLQKRFPQISKEDMSRLSFCGCTETCLDGISRIGSTDAYYNTLELFRRYMNRHLASKPSFEAFYQGYLEAFHRDIDIFAERLNQVYRNRAQDLPHPVRTILTDDCIDKECDFNAGGARYNWSIFSFSGTVNTLESLLAVRELIYTTKEYSAEEFIRLLNAEDPGLYRRLRKCCHYGVDDERADALAADLFNHFFGCLDDKSFPFGAGFLSSSIHFITYVLQGKHVGPTPCGRRNGDPLCDSISPIMGNDRQSVTAALNSVTRLPLSRALGTPVLNLRLEPETARGYLRPLMETYFEKGGLQAQINCISTQDMKDAMIHPEKHGDLLVKTGGYIEYFVKLDPQTQQTIIDRTEHKG